MKSVATFAGQLKRYATRD